MSHARLFERGVADRSVATRDPSQTNATRHLAAILAADVAGDSRLMGADEERNHERLKALRRQLVDPKNQEHPGRIVQTNREGMLAEFPSVVDAVRCAVEVQRAMVDRNTDIAEDKRIAFRIGVNLGDVIAEGGDIYGDGVNVAARLEALAEPGGICISGTVWDHIRDKLPYSFEDTREQSGLAVDAAHARQYRRSIAPATLKVYELAPRSTPALPARPDQRVLDEYCGANGWRKKAALEPSASDAAKQLFLPGPGSGGLTNPSPSR